MSVKTKAILENLLKNLGLAIIFWLPIAGILIHYKIENVQLIVLIILIVFIFLAIYNTYLFTTLKYQRKYREKQEWEERWSTPVEILITELGDFTYSKKGFTLEFDGCIHNYEWGKIKTVLAYKIDMFTYDLLALDILFSDDIALKVNESTRGWFQFLVKLSESLEEIPNDWADTISIPAFETKLTVLYDKQHRTLEEIVKEEYH